MEVTAGEEIRVYGYTMKVAQDIGTYHALHRAILDLAGRDYDGLVLHLAAPTPQGYELTEVWESRDRLDAFNRDVLPAAMQAAGVTLDPAAVQVTEFEPEVVITPRSFSSDERRSTEQA
jgi:hypothetical protein